MELEIDEFIHRFLLQILPKGFFKVRYYGNLAKRYRKQNTKIAEHLLEKELDNLGQEKQEDGESLFIKKHTFWGEIWPQIKEYKKPNCPACKKGRLCFTGIVPRE